MMENNAGNKFAFDAIKIGMASPEQIRGSHADLNRVKGKLVAVIGFDHVALSSFNDSNDPVLW